MAFFWGKEGPVNKRIWKTNNPHGKENKNGFYLINKD